MAAEPASALDDDVIRPSIEIGAFEALWATQNITSFKQLRDKLTAARTDLPSGLIDHLAAKSYYQQTINRLHSAGVNKFCVILDGTIDYPSKLHDADHPLALLYYQGTWDLVFRRGIAVVGTRHPTSEGIQRTRSLVKKLVAENFTIYSGLAVGIDTAAHKAAIANGGSTIAVIGTPLSHCYPRENKELQKTIAHDHLLISQVPVISYDAIGSNLTRLFFPERNKTMAALSEATVIVEAGETSGTLIQARAALKQGRKVFILNNNFENSKLTWPHKLEQKGAIRVHDIKDILKGLVSECQ